VTPTDVPNDAPKLLLDANIFRRLGEGKLAAYEERLLQIAKSTTPPLFWVCPITLEELFGNLRGGKPEEFVRIQAALAWTDRLCGVDGIAEELAWIVKRGLFVNAQPYDRELSFAFDSARRPVIEAASFENIPSDVIDAVRATSAIHFANMEKWLPSRVALIEEAKLPPDPDKPVTDTTTLVTNTSVSVFRRRHDADRALWGEFKSVEDQAIALRELFAFDMWHLDQAAEHANYNVQKRKGDYNDRWLCAYPAAGYELVTFDTGIFNASTKCNAPRVRTLDQAVSRAEAWLKTESRS
jgi:hypothetical protein